MTRHRCHSVLAFLALPALLLAAGASPSLANCLNPAAAYSGFGGGAFTGCGETAYAFVWQHQRAVQRIVSGSLNSIPGGVDTGANAVLGDGIFVAESAPGSYNFVFDWGNYGNDGCPLTYLEPDTGACGATTSSLPVSDFVLSGRNGADPFTALAAVVSVDGNELYQMWVLDNAGAPSVDGNPCGDDASSFKSPPDVVCGAIPRPDFDSLSCTSLGCDVTLTVGPSAVPILNDCQVANSKAIDCIGPAEDPRNLYIGRQLFFKKAPCDTPPADTRTYIMTRTSSPGTATPNFIAYSVEDANLNGILDPGEDGSHGGMVNGHLDPFILPGNAPETRTVFIPPTTAPTECVYLGVGLALDRLPIPPAEPVVTPLVSMNPVPVSAPCDPVDHDGDGFSGCQGDCDDSDPAIHPGAAEICNGRDDNCDGRVDEGGGAVLCDDGNVCTQDLCGGASGCANPPAPDGTACDDGMACTTDDACHAGVCAGSAAPSISFTLSPAYLMPANHKMIQVTATVTAMDACGRPLTGILASVTSSEPDDAPGAADGNTLNDIQGADLGTADYELLLRAERSRYGTGRYYTVVYTATNPSGQQATATGYVLVPRDPSWGRTPSEPVP